MKRIIIFSTLLVALVSTHVFAQDPTRFAEEVKKFENAAANYPEANRIVFTGSSSIRLWVDFKSYFPNHNVINTGFGGSETSDLLHYKDLLISQFKPKQVFIYEGDNDINSGKAPNAVIGDIAVLVTQLLDEGVESIVLISAKPSIARWELKETYEEFNEKLAKLSMIIPNVYYADTWSTMMLNDGTLQQDIFLEDDLHMNKKGYDLWIDEIRPLLIQGK
ncbi:GDSL-type esterase/lipase family protein [Roseivirga pacifica]|uniref:GDSL-type esterase/lipase family protein n=1 Tax=Roseivirga pacifica TaxID=1267423 RepID=UPI002095AA59|nr:GDSL-type esterase/lipase family protein [Roseivirga pacifica]MCO6360133.1 G-D-S-L family lipolytic protein [Roseivirga pacifica]MCO6367504.1 G-D-S-L family lipolytic protein [Roseivirga pacifica]MCO6369965.1 G-D-S-L family lipolytic protein [Roseivirga pacifica]MCO6375160.1 G-D-S-L family lipolytic protein [Roseivirga pacifica]MCO6380419.1 G-D-S-L family lipolytic protein [Roseivirga pacifica]